jgi:hypothetical protein
MVKNTKPALTSETCCPKEGERAEWDVPKERESNLLEGGHVHFRCYQQKLGKLRKSKQA